MPTSIPQGGAEEFDSERARIRLRIEELQRGPLPPSFVIDSGGGMQVVWKLDEPIEIDAASQNRVENIGRAIAYRAEGGCSAEYRPHHAAAGNNQFPERNQAAQRP